MAHDLLRRGQVFAVVAPGKSLLTAVPGKVVLSGAEGERPTEELLAPVIDAGGVVLVDDADLLDDESVLLKYLGAPGCGGVIAAGSVQWSRSLRGLAPALARGRNGLLLTPQMPADGSPLGMVLRNDDCFNGPKGRGLLTLGGGALLVQVPMPPEEPA
jgi:hypothetical protein